MFEIGAHHLLTPPFAEPLELCAMVSDVRYLTFGMFTAVIEV